MRAKIKAQQVWRKAEIHRLACKTGVPRQDMPFELCECCDHIIHKYPIGPGQHSKQLQMYGFGYPLWFSYLKHCMLLIFVLIVSKTAVQLYTSSVKNVQFCYGNSALDAVGLNGVQGSATHAKLLQSKASNEKSTLFHKSKRSGLYLRRQHYSKNQIQKESQFLPQSQSSQLHYSQHLIPLPGKGQIRADGSQNQCTSFMIYLSFFQRQPLIENAFLKIIQFLAIFFALIYIRNTIIKQQQYYDQSTCTLSDYTLMVSGIPKGFGIRKSIQDMFRQQFDKVYGREIKKMLFVFQDQELNQLKQKTCQLQLDIIEAQKSDDLNELRLLQNQLKQIQDAQIERIANLKRYIAEDKVQCDKMIIIMATQKDKAEVLYKFQKTHLQGMSASLKKHFDVPFVLKSQITKEKQPFLIKQCNEPGQIIWDNIDRTQNKRKFKSLLGWLVMLAFLAVSTIVYYYVIKVQTKVLMKSMEDQTKDEGGNIVLRALAFLIIGVTILSIVLMNKFVISKIIKMIVKWEKHGYSDKENISYAVKYATAMFFTTAVMALIVESVSDNHKNGRNNNFGIIQEQSTMFFITSFLIPVIWLINPQDFIQQCKRFQMQGELVPQQQANRVMQDAKYDLSKKYAEIFKLIWFTFLYSELIPLGSFLTLLGLGLYFWIDKRIFLHSACKKPGVSGRMAIIALKSADACLFLAPLGQVLFNIMFHRQLDIVSLYLTILGLVYLFLPINDMLLTFNNERFGLQYRTYDEAKSRFRQTYQSLHPVYSITHRDQNQLHRAQLRAFWQNEIKKTKWYGAGRGKYEKDGGYTEDSQYSIRQ